MDKLKYHLIPEESSNTCAQVETPHHKKNVVKRNVIFTTTLSISILLNIYLLWRTLFRQSIGPVSRSLYAGLLNDVDIPYRWNTKYSGENYTEVNQLWYSDTEADKGVIAVDKSYAAKLNLPPSQSFPWDKTKKFYVTNGHHALHCLRAIYISLDQFRFSQPQTWTWPHVLHCLDTLRSDIICSADDNLRWTGDTGLFIGEGQNRKCRDWNKLNEFVEKHPGCFRYIEENNTQLANAERVKFCKNDSPYLPTIRQFFGLEEDWMPWPRKE